jgi:hypothetical protein
MTIKVLILALATRSYHITSLSMKQPFYHTAELRNAESSILIFRLKTYCTSESIGEYCMLTFG